MKKWRDEGVKKWTCEQLTKWPCELEQRAEMMKCCSNNVEKYWSEKVKNKKVIKWKIWNWMNNTKRKSESVILKICSSKPFSSEMMI